jgi:D-hydroxyproline dehydrogenase subunit alpha
MARWIVVIGAGPAGLAASVEAAARKCRVTLLDEAPRPGGQIYRQPDPALDATAYAEPAELVRKQRLLDDFTRVAGAIDYRAGASVYAMFPNGEVHVARDDATEVLRPDAVILATGVRETAIPFPGWTIPGVMFAGGAQALLKSQGVLPGRRIVVAGCGPLPIVVAAQITRAGGEVQAFAGLNSMAGLLHHPRGLWHGRRILWEGLRYLAILRRAGVPRLADHVPIRAIGSDRLEAVVLGRVDRDGNVVAGTAREIACDLLAVNYGFVANSELAAMAGARMRHDAVAGWVPVADPFGRTSVEKLFAAGDCAGLRGALVAETEGRIVGAAAATGVDDAALARELRGLIARRQKHQAFPAALRASFRLPRELWALVEDDTIVCRCENVTGADIRCALRGGHVTPNAIKRQTRAGMGWCAGRTCLRAVTALTELHSGLAPTAMMTPRPMARPVSFAALANQTRAQA